MVTELITWLKMRFKRTKNNKSSYQTNKRDLGVVYKTIFCCLKWFFYTVNYFINFFIFYNIPRYKAARINYLHRQDCVVALYNIWTEEGTD